MKRSNEIYGFYYDEVKKKYFRINPTSSNNNCNPLTSSTVTKLKSQEKVKKELAKESCISLPLSLRNQEINVNLDKLNLKEIALKSHFCDLKYFKNFKLNPIDYHGDILKNPKCIYLISYSPYNNLCGIWSGERGSTIYQMFVDENLNVDYRIVNCFSPGNKVVDLCYAQNFMLNNCIVYTTQHYRENGLVVSSVSIKSIGNHIAMRDIEMSDASFEIAKAAFSCAYMPQLYCGVGCESRIFLCRFDELGTSVQKAFGNVLSMNFNSKGNKLIFVNNKGELGQFDLRLLGSRKPITYKKVSKSSLNYIKILSNDNNVIVSGHHNQLKMFDLRNTNTHVVKYPQFENDCYKFPFSIDETVEVISSPCQDSVVRFWSLYTGKLLHCHFTDLDKNNCDPVNYAVYSHSWNFLKDRPVPVLFQPYGNSVNIYSKFRDLL